MHPRLIELAVAALAATSLGLLAALAWSGSVRAALTLQGYCETAAAPSSSAIVGAIVAAAALFWLSRRQLVDGG
jgi:Family of unknown function (DUF5654)